MHMNGKAAGKLYSKQNGLHRSEGNMLSRVTDGHMSESMQELSAIAWGGL